jgi:hypothetical protein
MKNKEMEVIYVICTYYRKSKELISGKGNSNHENKVGGYSQPQYKENI